MNGTPIISKPVGLGGLRTSMKYSGDVASRHTRLSSTATLIQNEWASENSPRQWRTK